jgi:choline kinase
MQAIILAAGMGKRLGKLTNSDTKCMLEVNGIKLIDRALEALENAGITRLCIVIGYKGSRVQDYLGFRWGSIDISYVENLDYSKTNNIYSLLLASDFLVSDDTILLESDLIFEKEVIKELIEDPRENVVLVDKFQTWMDGTVISFN